MFSRFLSSWTPYFLRDYGRKVTLGQGVGYYLFWSSIFLLLGSIFITCVFGFFTTPEKILPRLETLPPFEFQFEDNVLTRTHFTTDPYIFTADDAFVVMVSPTSEDFEPAVDLPFLALLKNKVQILDQEKRLYSYTYDEFPIGSLVLNNAFVSEKAQTLFPVIRGFALPIMFIVIFLAGILFIGLNFFTVLFWSAFLWVIQRIFRKTDLTFSQILGYVFHVFFPVMFVIMVISIAFDHFVLLGFLATLMIYSYHLLGLRTV